MTAGPSHTGASLFVGRKRGADLHAEVREHVSTIALKNQVGLERWRKADVHITAV